MLHCLIEITPGGFRIQPLHTLDHFVTDQECGKDHDQARQGWPKMRWVGNIVHAVLYHDCDKSVCTFGNNVITGPAGGNLNPIMSLEDSGPVR